MCAIDLARKVEAVEGFEFYFGFTVAAQNKSAACFWKLPDRRLTGL